MDSTDLSAVFTPFPVLETPRLILREMRSTDVAPLLGVFGDPQVAQYLDGPVLTTLDEVQYIVDWAAGVRERRTGIRWALSLKGQEEPIGTCGFHRWEHTHFRAETGYELSSAYWRQGFMSEALRAIFAFGFERMALHRVEAITDPRNEASLRLLASLGFQQEGILRDYECYNDAFHTLAILGLLRSDFQ